MPIIFVSYRRDDTPHAAERVFDYLHDKYRGLVFRDIDSIKPGASVRIAIATALKQCEVVVAIVGPDWLGQNPDGSLRINAPQDWVRNEIEIAVQLGIPIIPVMVDLDSQHPAKWPTQQQVPDTLYGFVALSAVRAETGRSFKVAMDQVAGQIEAHRRVRSKYGPANLVRNVTQSRIPPALLIVAGAIALLIGWLMLQWYEAKDAEWFDDTLHALGTFLEFAGLIVAVIGIVLAVQSRSRRRA
jgi:hypothetical protein